MSGGLNERLYRVCAKVYAEQPDPLGDLAALLVPIFHQWIREQALDTVMLDVADYSHVPEGPGVLLVCHEVSFSLGSSDGRLGLEAQRRVPGEGGAVTSLATTLRQALEVAGRLERDPRLAGRLRFDTSAVRIEINDRLWAPNTTAGFEAMEPLIQEAVAATVPGVSASVRRVDNDPRERLALEIALGSPSTPSKPRVRGSRPRTSRRSGGSAAEAR